MEEICSLAKAHNIPESYIQRALTDDKNIEREFSIEDLIEQARNYIKFVTKIYRNQPCWNTVIIEDYFKSQKRRQEEYDYWNKYNFKATNVRLGPDSCSIKWPIVCKDIMMEKLKKNFYMYKDIYLSIPIGRLKFGEHDNPEQTMDEIHEENLNLFLDERLNFIVNKDFLISLFCKIIL